MDNTNQAEEKEVKQEVIVSPVTELEDKPQENSKRNWLSYLTLFFVLCLIIALILLTLWMVEVFNVYNKASVYKESYDIVQEQIIFCDKIKGTSQKQEIFNYCEQFNERFKVIERDTENQ